MCWNEELKEIEQTKQYLHVKWISTQKVESRIEGDPSKIYRQIIQNKKEIFDRICRQIDNHIGGRKSREAWKIFIIMRKQTWEKCFYKNVISLNQFNCYEELLQGCRTVYMKTVNSTHIIRRVKV